MESIFYKMLEADRLIRESRAKLEKYELDYRRKSRFIIWGIIMFVLIVVSLLTFTGPMGMKGSGGMNGFSVSGLSEKACKEAKKEIIEEAQKKLGIDRIIVICQKAD